MFGFMIVVRVPDNVLPSDTSVSQEQGHKPSFSDEHAEKLQDILHHDFKVEVYNCVMWCTMAHL